MSLTSPVSYVSNNFSLYRASLFLIYCNCYNPTNQIRSMMSLTIMGLTPGSLVRALSLFVLMNPLVMLTILLVVFVAWVLEFFS